MTYKFEKSKIDQGYKYVIGCDEVGRGCLAGPVVAAAVVMNHKTWNMKHKIKDSKLLSSEMREELTPLIKEKAIAWSIAEVSSKEIDKINIHHASLLAMKRAVDKLTASLSGVILSPSASEGEESRPKAASLGPSASPQDDGKKFLLVVDGKFKIPDVQLDQEAIISGDNKVLSIAAASIIAKVYRDSLMEKLHETYPVYNLKQHKGYATAFHRRVILKQGLSPIHRLTFCQSLLPLP